MVLATINDMLKLHERYQGEMHGRARSLCDNAVSRSCKFGLLTCGTVASKWVYARLEEFFSPKVSHGLHLQGGRVWRWSISTSLSRAFWSETIYVWQLMLCCRFFVTARHFYRRWRGRNWLWTYLRILHPNICTTRSDVPRLVVLRYYPQPGPTTAPVPAFRFTGCWRKRSHQSCLDGP